MRARREFRALRCAFLAGGMTTVLAAGALGHDYPTETLADYLFACMATNGQTPDALKKCSCSIDVIASILPHDEYIQAETVLRMRQVPGGGEKMAIFRDTPLAKDTVEHLKRAQVEAELRCF
jgi:hypothetical protein